MTQLRRDAAYIRTKSHERSTGAHALQLSQFDEQLMELLNSAHTVKSAAKTLSRPTDASSDESRPTDASLDAQLTDASSDASSAELEARVAESMQRLLQAERIQLSPDS